MKCIIMLGPSGCGKSTWVEQFLNNPENQNYIRINRDSIRECLIPNHLNTWYQRPDRDNLEKLTSSIEYDLIDVANYFDKDVIIDATNVDKKRLEAFLAYLSKHYEEVDIYIKIMECSLKTAQNRVYKRLGFVFTNFDDNEIEVVDYSNEPEVQYIEEEYEEFKNTLQYLKTQSYTLI